MQLGFNTTMQRKKKKKKKRKISPELELGETHPLPRDSQNQQNELWKISKSAKAFYYYIYPSRWRVAKQKPIYILSTQLGVTHIYTLLKKWA